MVKPKLVFFGTSEICLPFLEVLKKRFDLELIISQPDAYGGRNRKKILVPPVKVFAMQNNIPVEQPETLKDDILKDKIRAVEPALGVVIAYGKLIPRSVFTIPGNGMVNVHFSMLPLYRGAAPVQRGIENGDTKTGITIFELVKKMDAGPVWAQREFDILPDDTTETVWKRLSSEGAEFLADTVVNILEGKIEKHPQDESKATFARPVQKEEGLVDWTQTARQIYNKFRAFTPWPGVCCEVAGKQFKLTNIKPAEDVSQDRQPGDVWAMDKKSLKVACGSGTVLEVIELQPQGKKPMTPYCYCLGNELPERFC